MPNKRKPGKLCTGHIISLCGDNKKIVMDTKNEIELKHPSNISQAINLIIERYREARARQNVA